MANEKYYAWSRIMLEADAGARVTKSLMPGEVANQGDFDKDEWEYFVNTGVVRTTPYPDMGSFDGSPNDYYRSLIEKAMSPDIPVDLTTDRLSDTEAKNLQEAGLVPAGAEPVNEAQTAAKNK